jgi:hypothetical protein
MTDQRELDRLLDAYFVDGADELADRVIDAALDQVDHTDQRRAVRMPRRFQTMNMPTRVAAAASEHGLSPVGVIVSPLPGPAGNIEFPLHATVGSRAAALDVEAALVEGRALAGVTS